MKHIELSTQAQKDLMGLDKPTRKRLADGIEADLAAEPAPGNADVKPLKGAEPWMRLRIGDYRVLYRPLRATELAPLVADVAKRSRPKEGYLVARVVHRQALERAVATL